MKTSNIKPVDEALKEHYAAKSLSDNQLDQLMVMQELAAESAAEKTVEHLQVIETISPTGVSRFLPAFHSYRSAFYATAAMLVVCLAVTLSLINQTPLTERIMDEIAYNHKQNMPIEVASNSLDDIRNYLDKLSFPIISPSALGKPNWEFLGGRYCSINGKLAAQLKIKNTQDNNIYTLYQAASDGGIAQSGAARLTQMIDGVGVSVWREKGLLLGLASSP